MQSQDDLKNRLADEDAWVDKVSREVRDYLIGEGDDAALVPAEVRIQILGLLDEKCRPHAQEQAKTIWKLRLQRRVLSGVALLLLVGIGLGTLRYDRVEAVATARVWRIWIERQIIAARTGVEAAKRGMIWTNARLKEIDEEPGDSPEQLQDKATRKQNAILMGNQVLAQKEICDLTVQKLQAAEMPTRIDRFTYFKDPFTGKTIALNATTDGAISEKDVETYLKQDNLIVRMLAAAKAYSQPGAEPLPPFLLDETVLADRERVVPAALQERLKQVDDKAAGR